MRGVPAVDIERLVRLRVTEALRLGEHVAVGGVPVLHLGEDVIAGPVQDAVDPRKPVGDESLAQGFDDGDATGHGGLEVEVSAILLRRREDFRPMLADQRLVGRDDDLAIPQGGERHFSRQRGSAHQFADDVNGRVVRDRERVVGELGRGDFHRPDLAPVAHRGPGEVEFHADARLEVRAVGRDMFPHALPHRAEAAKANVDRQGFAHGWDRGAFWPILFSVPASRRARLARCRRTTKRATPAETPTSTGVRSKASASKGSESAAKTEASET